MTLHEAEITLYALRDATTLEMRLAHSDWGWSVEVLRDGRWTPLTEKDLEKALAQ
jgi:hypothetical protein